MPTPRTEELFVPEVMALSTDTSFHWLTRRIGLITLLVLIFLNALTILVAVIYVANTPEGGTNILAQILIALDGFAFWLMFAASAVVTIIWFAARDTRPYLRAVMSWVVLVMGAGALGWWLLGILTKRTP